MLPVTETGVHIIGMGGNVQAGQTIEINPNDNGIVRIDNKFVGRSSKHYQPEHEYDVYFRG